MNLLSRAAGRVLIAGFPGRSWPDALRSRSREGALGGAILFSRNLGTLEETRALVEQLYDEWPDGDAPLIAIDQEGGRVARLKAPFVLVPPMRTLGERDDVLETKETGRALGRELRALGIGVNFAPVLDVDTNPANPVIGDRSFGSDPERVIRHALALAEGLGEEGVIACGKHFPGHGDTELDSHLDLPRLVHDRARLDRVELAPFVAASRARIPMIMTAHIVFSAIDPDRPATLSRRVITELLREEIGYQGVIVSDDLEMKAIADRHPIEDAAILAIEAGCDALLICSDPERVSRAQRALADRAARDSWFAERLLDATSRIDALPRLRR